METEEPAVQDQEGQKQGSQVQGQDQELNGLTELDQVQARRRRSGPPPPAHRKAQGAAGPAGVPGQQAGQENGGQTSQPAAGGTGPEAQEATRRGQAPASGGASRGSRPGSAVARTSGNAAVTQTPVREDPLTGSNEPFEPGPGRPVDIPPTIEILQRRSITRSPLNASVPADLRLSKRLKRFALDRDLEHLPMGDVVGVALDEWLSSHGY
jgi:hypothetical protein